MVKAILIFSMIFILNQELISQSSELGNFEVYTRELKTSSFGYFRSSFNMPGFNQPTQSQNGVSFTHFYDLWRIGDIQADTDNEFTFYLTGEFKLGAAAGNKIRVPEYNDIRGGNFRYFSATIDLFSLYFIPEYTLVLANGNAIRLKFGLQLLNLGGTIVFPEHSVLKRYSLATINIIPLGFAPSAFFDFGRTGLGFAAYLNLDDILSYNIAPSDVYGREAKGVKSFDSIISRYDFQISFLF